MKLLFSNVRLCTIAKLFDFQSDVQLCLIGKSFGEFDYVRLPNPIEVNRTLEIEVRLDSITERSIRYAGTPTHFLLLGIDNNITDRGVRGSKMLKECHQYVPYHHP